jgi:hypothetical protein
MRSQFEAIIKFSSRKNTDLSLLKKLVVLCILDRKQTQIKHKQADLRGSPKPGTPTEVADCILLEE